MTGSVAAGFDLSSRSHLLTSFPMISAGRCPAPMPIEVPGLSSMNLRRLVPRVTWKRIRFLHAVPFKGNAGWKSNFQVVNGLGDILRALAV
jgi:hypothetical protein